MELPSATSSDVLHAFLAEVLADFAQRFFFFRPGTYDYFVVPTYVANSRLSEAVERFLEMSAQGADVFLEARDDSRTFVSCGLSTPGALASLAFFPLPPSAVLIEDAVGTHSALWFLDSVLSGGGELVDQRIAQALNGKPTFSRYVRLPGTVNHSAEAPYEVRLADFAATRYTVGEVEEALRTAGS